MPPWIPYLDSVVKDGSYSVSGLFTDVSKRIVEADGKTIGIVGMGTIGRRVASVAEAFGMKVIYFSTSGTNHCTDYPAVTLDELLSRSDVVTVHAPLNERTNGLIGEAELRRMKPTAFIVNMGRGGIIDEKALAAPSWFQQQCLGGAVCRRCKSCRTRCRIHLPSR